MNHAIHHPSPKAFLCSFVLLTTFSAHAQLLNFSQLPAGSTARDPAPNLIVSVDDSGSMGWDVNGCMTPDFATDIFGLRNDTARPVTAPACPVNAHLPGNNPTPSRLANLRAAVRQTFGDPNAGTLGILNDGEIRLAWQALHDTGANTRTLGLNGLQNTLQANGVNAIRPFSGPHRTNFDRFLSSLNARSGQGTPLHRSMESVRNYMSLTGVNGPYANVPGTELAPELSCRRTYHILMTDGAWNNHQFAATNVGNADGNFGRTFPDGTTYNNSPQTRIYSDVWGGAKGTIADWSFANWTTDFQPNLTNNIRPLFPAPEPENVVRNDGLATVSIAPYWNPRNNPMNWQGVTQYTIGFGVAATDWVGGPAWDNATDNNYGPGYVSRVHNQSQWIDLFNPAWNSAELEARRSSDLWHAALNGRGLYYPARTADDLRDAFEDILNDIQRQNDRPLVTIATNSSRARANNTLYVAGYNSNNWSGSLEAFAINATTSLPANSPTWRAQALLDARTDLSSRVIWTHNGTQGVPFLWGNLTTGQQGAVRGADLDAVGLARINYLRGDRSSETRTTGDMRVRSSRLGDVVNSNIWYMGAPRRSSIELPGQRAFRTTFAARTPVLWVGANDGMLHGFNAENGQEVLAYVPRGLFGSAANSPLRSLTQINYTHRYYVDGSPFTGDVNTATTGTPNWRTMLVGTLGAGGKGYFVLDVTNPSAYNNAATVVLDQTAPTNADIGHIFGNPVIDELTGAQSEQIVRVNSTTSNLGRWAVILGNGLNSTNQRPVLLVQYLDGTRALVPVVASTATGQGNGLGSPRPVDLNGDGKVDVVYAGDMRGNLWKFDLSSPNSANWTASFGRNPLFTARDSNGSEQPITAAPVWRVGYDRTGVQVLFGTGRNVTATDPGSAEVQTVYSVWDQSTFAPSTASTVTLTDGTRITGNRSDVLVEQTQNNADTGARFFTTSSNAVPYQRGSTTAPRGWFFDLPVSRERVLFNPQLFQGPMVQVNSIAPTISVDGETCDANASRSTGFLSFFDIYSGRPPTTSVFGSTDGNRVTFGTGESASQRDLAKGQETMYDPSLLCRGDDCPCIGDSCEPPCQGPDCARCGGLKGPLLQTCEAGLGGARSDWREMR